MLLCILKYNANIHMVLEIKDRSDRRVEKITQWGSSLFQSSQIIVVVEGHVEYMGVMRSLFYIAF